MLLIFNYLEDFNLCLPPLNNMCIEKQYLVSNKFKEKLYLNHLIFCTNLSNN